ncbi:hypothetical protein HHO41_03760 [Bacillus sp. DNRA2]|uniref:hypothetical protein n=1 Tax=Bacillus sp. DNRA2 TaxID=2723053 RepID=UPI00145E08E9|nr:hypothetical protein [Bacillus sp. DNRA2]NMD69392.1 hypothetical protein [Bacillus sp. DNRA2]
MIGGYSAIGRISAARNALFLMNWVIFLNNLKKLLGLKRLWEFLHRLTNQRNL